MHPILFLILLVVVLASISWLKRLPPTQRAAMLKKVLIYGGGLLLIVAVLSGRLNPLFAVLGGLIPIAYRALNAYRLFQTARASLGGAAAGRGSAASGQSQVRTRYLVMTLDQSTGSMDGTVQSGRNAGQALSALSLNALLELLGEYSKSDPESAALLEAFLDQHHAGWRAHASGESHDTPNAASSEMSREEAAALLGVAADATPDEIRAAHRRLMQKLHPDRGGSDYLAARVNLAKRKLLGEGPAG